MAAKSSDWRPGPTVCRCCFAEGCYKDISTEYFWMGKREVYAEMLSDTFDLSISYSQISGPNSNSRLICEPCISRLRDASDFKKQVQDCEKTFIQFLDPGRVVVEEIHVPVEPLPRKDEVKVERVKEEDSEDGFDDRAAFADDDDDDLDDEPLMNLATKVPKTEVLDEALLTVDMPLETAKRKQKPEKRKAVTKAKASPAKKPKNKEAPKASASKAPKPVAEKKKKADNHDPARSNAEIIIRCTTAYPFRINAKSMLCVYCQELFDDPSIFREHMAKEHAEYSIKVAFYNLPKSEFIKADVTDLNCRLCSQQFADLDSIAGHLKQTHDQALDLSGKLGVMPYVLKNDEFRCVVCGKNHPSLFHLNRHTITHFLAFVCHVCGQSYVATTGLLRHVRSKHQDYEVSCKSCNKVFPTMEAKEKHRRTEKSCYPYVCPRCRERFIDFKARRKHMETQHGHEKKSLRCVACDISFPVESAYYEHFKLLHSDDCLSCKHCGLRFLSHYRLKRHLKRHSL